MSEIFKIENIETIKKAIEVEIKHHYIDIMGKTCSFSKFITSELRTISKMDKKSPKWKVLIATFERYPLENVSSRIKAVKHLISHLQNPFENPQPKEEKTGQIIRNPQDVDVMYVKGVGPKVASLLNKIGIYTAEDLIRYYPRKYLDYATRTKICDLEIGKDVTIFGTIKSVNIFQSKKRNNLTILSITVSDGTGFVSASWFYGKANKYMMDKYKAQFPKGANIIISGTVKFDNYTGMFSIDKPETSIISSEFEEENKTERLHSGRIVPVYPLTENLNVKVVRRAIYNALDIYCEKIIEHLPDEIIEKNNLIGLTEALRQIHFPDSTKNLDLAKKRLVFDEFFLFQLKLAQMRKENKKAGNGVSLEIKPDGLVTNFVKALPFKLTKGQEKAFNEILSDLQNEEPMQRLLQGDVGSGKTVIACMALLSAIENGFQAAIMAPTEILAEQHYRNFTQWLTPLGVSVGLFVGKHGAKIKREMKQNLQNGQINVAVGTHALIQDEVTFNNLGLVVIDEQHRFGVKQRQGLKNKGINPEMLTMTATPIPRTLALTLHGDLDVTTIDELPPGRKPVKTALVNSLERKKAYQLIRDEIEKGNKAYIVFPLIEESETLSAKAATKEAEKLKKGVFSDLQIGLVHGKLPSQEKDSVMEDFRKGKYNILVSTTVIEVGVDVPDATVMLIENAERFGLSQLHQLRGRVGRSELQSYCILATDSKTTETLERLKVMVKTNNGFIIAESDMQIRGPGEFMGTRQSGMPDFAIADIVNDTEILELARNTAFAFNEKYNVQDYPLLYKKLDKNIEDGLDLIGAG